jgi:hypothetical protein
MDRAHPLLGEQRGALIDEALELEGFHLGAILLALASTLFLLVTVEMTLNAVDRAVKDVDGRPQQVAKVRFEAGTHGEDRLHRVAARFSRHRPDLTNCRKFEPIQV